MPAPHPGSTALSRGVGVMVLDFPPAPLPLTSSSICWAIPHILHSRAVIDIHECDVIIVRDPNVLRHTPPSVSGLRSPPATSCVN